MNFRLSCLAAAVCAAAVPVAVAVAAGPAVEEQEVVLVTATRTAQLADEVLAPTVVITREEIERMQAVDLADVLRFHAGFDIGRNGGPGQPASLFIRGTDSNHALVLIDGVRMNPGTIGGAALQNIDPALVERIEVVKGPRSSLYGSDAIGGVVNIITRRAAQGTQANAAVGGGSFMTRRFSAGVRHALGGTRVGVEAALNKTDGFPPRTASDIKAGHDNLSVNAHLGHRFSLLDVELSHFEASGDTEYLDFFLTPVDQDFKNSVTALRLEASPTSNWTSRLRLSQAKDEIDQNQSPDYAHTERLTADWQNDIRLGRAQLLTLGVEGTREKTAAESFGTVFDEERDISAVYVQDAIEYGAHRAVLAARYTDYDGFGDHLTWDVEYGYWLTPATRLSAAAGTAFRAPDSSDRFGFGGNPDLKPEESRNIEIGLRHRFSPSQRASLQIFHNEIDELIEFAGDDGMTNIAEARIRGVEAGYDYDAGPWHFGLTATVQDPQSRDTGNQLPRRAERSATARLVYTADRWQFGADVLAASDRRDSDFSTAVLAGYGITNLTAAVFLTRDWTLRARVENAFDKEYALADGYNTAERSYLLQLAWQYGG